MKIRVRVLFCLRWTFLMMADIWGTSAARSYYDQDGLTEPLAYIGGFFFAAWFLIWLLFHRYEERTRILTEGTYSIDPPPSRR